MIVPISISHKGLLLLFRWHEFPFNKFILHNLNIASATALAYEQLFLLSERYRLIELICLPSNCLANAFSLSE